MTGLDYTSNHMGCTPHAIFCTSNMCDLSRLMSLAGSSDPLCSHLGCSMHLTPEPHKLKQRPCISMKHCCLLAMQWCFSMLHAQSLPGLTLWTVG